MRKLFKGGIVALVPAALVAGALSIGSAHADVSTVTSSTHIQNNPDSGNGGTWAIDQVDRSVTVTLATDQSSALPGQTIYSATVTDTGTFKAIAGAQTPNQSVPGQTISHDVEGSVTGTAVYTVVAPSDAVLGDTFPANLNDNFNTAVGDTTTGRWPEQAFTPSGVASATIGNWSWTYTTPAGETWTDSSTNGDGNVVSDGNITGLRVRPAALPVLSHGHALSLGTARENVFFTLSGTPTWVHFQIFGVGNINGHEGWVNAKLGVDAAVYGGLRAGHTYLVYYTPVEGKGSEVQIPGTKSGSHVTFVTATK